MLGKSNDKNDSQTSGVLVQYIRELSDYLRESDLSKKAVTLAVAALMLVGVTMMHYDKTGSFVPTSAPVSKNELPIYCVQTNEPKIALTFDAAWGNKDTKKIMDVLKKHDVKVTFFMTGGWVDTYPDDVKMVLSQGHDLGNHTQNHKNMSKLTDSEKEAELMSVHDKVKALTGYEMFLFRPPYGDYDSAVVETAKKCGYYAVQWDVDILDT